MLFFLEHLFYATTAIIAIQKFLKLFLCHHIHAASPHHMEYKETNVRTGNTHSLKTHEG